MYPAIIVLMRLLMRWSNCDCICRPGAEWHASLPVPLLRQQEPCQASARFQGSQGSVMQEAMVTNSQLAEKSSADELQIHNWPRMDGGRICI